MLYEQKLYVHITYRKCFHMLYGQKVFVLTTYGKVVHKLYVQVVYICHIGNVMSDDTEYVHNESIYINYLRKRYMNIAPTRHNLSFTERQNLP